MFFIVVVLVFHYTGEDTDDTCGFLGAPPTYSTAQVIITIINHYYYNITLLVRFHLRLIIPLFSI